MTGAARHVRSAVVLALDLRSFFASVPARRVYGVLRTAGYPEPVAHAVTGLLTTATPVRVIASMPPGGSPEQRHALRRALAESHLAQGAPTSPQASNLVAHGLDVRISAYARTAGATYTRYADDLVLSGGPGRAPPRRRRARRRGADRRRRGVRRQRGQDQGAVGGRPAGRHRHRRQRAPERPAPGVRPAARPAAQRRADTAPQAQNQERHPDFHAHLLGRIAWVESLNPGRGRRLRAELASITWS